MNAIKSKTKASPEEINTTFSHLIAKSKTSSVSSWSKRTIERAMGWASLKQMVMEKDTGVATDDCIVEFLESIACNPFASLKLRCLCLEELTTLRGETVASRA